MTLNGGGGGGGGAVRGGADAAERGSATVVVVAVLGAVLVVVSAVLGAAAHRVGSARAQGAADAAALAAAAAAVGLVPGAPCPAADRAARTNGAAVSSCSVRDAVAVVRVVVATRPFPTAATATAGPDTGASSSDPPGHTAHRGGASWCGWSSPSVCVWCACQTPGHRSPGRPGRDRVVQWLTSTIDQGVTCQARRSS